LTKRSLRELPAYLIYIVLFLLTVSYPFFWDTIQLASKHATYFYSAGFSSIILPNEIDSGHIPALGIYLAVIWKILGRTLIISHLAMLPFVVGIVYQTMILSRRLFSNRWYPWAALIILLDPSLMAQSTLVSPDVIVVFFFLLAVNSLMENKKIFLSLSLAGLTLASMRGMMCVAVLFVSEIILLAVRTKSDTGKLFPVNILSRLKKKAAPYIPAAIIAIIFFSWHYYKTGWIGYHENMPWAEFFERPDLKGAMFNLFILGWRIIDFGRLFVCIAGLFCLWHYFKNKPILSGDLGLTLTILTVLLLILGTAMVMHKNLSGHRYLIPVYLMFTISVLFYIFNVADETFPKKLLTIVMIAGLLSGNFWVYPDRIAKGWDSTLAYLPYFSVRQKMLDLMEEKNIKPDDTGTGFPNEDKFDFITLNGNMNSFTRRDLKSNRYIFWSNIFNDFSDAELDSLKSWPEIREMKSCQVKIILYRNPFINSQ
jgi:hypothetical protein